MLLWTPWLAVNILSNLKHYIRHRIYHRYIKHTQKWYNPFRPGGVCLSNLHRERDWIYLKGVPNLYHSADLKQSQHRASKHLQVSPLGQSSPSLVWVWQLPHEGHLFLGYSSIQCWCRVDLFPLSYAARTHHPSVSLYILKLIDRHKDSSFKSLQNGKDLSCSETEIPISPWHHYSVAITPRCYWDHI